MKMTRTAWTTLAALPLLAAMAPWVAGLAFAPAADTTVTRQHTFQLDFELGDISVVVDGQDFSEMIPGDFEATVDSKVEMRDTFVSSGGGRALELIRTFVSIEAEVEAMGESQEMDDADKMVGKSVRFQWNEDDGDYDVSYHECEGDEDDLDSLSADMDLSVLLPGREVAAGDTWTVPTDKLRTLLMLDKLTDSVPDDEMGQIVAAELFPQFDSMLESFKVSCEYKGEREVDGRSVGVIAVDLLGEGLVDLESVIVAAIESQNAGMDIDLSVNTAELTIGMTGKGELLWDLKAGLLRSFDLSADLEIGGSLSLDADAAGESHAMEGEVELLGRGSWKIRTQDGS